jgi:hypothetical protein
VEIPIWISKEVVPEDRSAINLTQLNESSAEIWMGITELQHSTLKLPVNKGHDYEWLATGAIPMSRVMKVMPFDGSIIHEEIGSEPIRVWSNQKPWIFDTVERQWCPEHEQTAKRMHIEEYNDDMSSASDQGPNKRPRLDVDHQLPEVTDSVKRCQTCKQALPTTIDTDSTVATIDTTSTIN